MEMLSSVHWGPGCSTVSSYKASIYFLWVPMYARLIKVQARDIVISGLHSFHITITYHRQFTETRCSSRCFNMQDLHVLRISMCIYIRPGHGWEWYREVLHANMFDHQGLSKHSLAFLSMLPRYGKWFGYWENYNNNIDLQFVPCTHIILHWKTHSMFTKVLITDSLLGP